MKRSPWRMRQCARLWQYLFLKVGKGDVEGMEVVARLSLDQQVIVATTHVSDADVGVAVNVLMDVLDLGIANQSMHHSLRENWAMYFILQLIGKDRFFPVDFTRRRNEIVGSFNPQNFRPMAEAMRRLGLAMLVPAHSPCFTGRLPDRGGLGAVYLAQVAKSAVILPVAVEVEYGGGMVLQGISPGNLFRKPIRVKTVIGAPMEFPTIGGIDDFPELVTSRVRTQKETVRYRSIQRSLMGYSNELMRRIATLLPSARRGRWALMV